MHRQVLKFFIAISLLSASSLAWAETVTTKTYPLPGHGFIQLQVPQSWRDELQQPPNGLPPTIMFTTENRGTFQMLLTPMYSINKEMVLPEPEEMKTHLENVVRNISQQAVEKTIPIKELKGPSVTGYYFFATDRAPNPGEYKYMTQGMVRVGALAPMFTILSNDGAEEAAADALSMLKSAIHIK